MAGSILNENLKTIASLSGAYVLVSLFFFKYPNLLFKKKNVAFTAKHISHRGGSGECYENTLLAFRRAIDFAETDMLEIDCHLTKDGKVVVVHDENLMKLTGHDIRVSSTRYDELPPLQSIVPIDFDPGKYFCDETVNEVDRKIPLLEEVFEKFNEIPVNIDIKRNDDELIEHVSQLISSYNREETCVWGNISSEITEKCYKRNPKVNLLFSRKKVILLLLCYYSGLLPFVPFKESHLEINLPSIYKKSYAYNKYPILTKIVANLMETVFIRKSLFTHLQKRGIQVYIWVLNEEDEFRKAYNVGATGIMTDYPQRLAQFMKNTNPMNEYSTNTVSN